MAPLPGRRAQAQPVEALVARRTVLESESAKLADAIAKGADVDAVLKALRERQAQLKELERTLLGFDHVKPTLPALDDAVRERLRRRLDEWQRVIESNPAEGNALLRRVLAAKISFRQREDERGPYYEFVGRATFGAVLSGFVPHTVMSATELANLMGLDDPQNLASPTGTARALEAEITLSWDVAA